MVKPDFFICSYQFIFADATVAEKVVAVILLAADEVINAFSSFALMALIKSKMTRSLSVFTLGSVPYLSNIYASSKLT